MGNQQVKGQHVWPTSCMPGIVRELHSDSSTDHEPDWLEEDSMIDPSEIENAISNGDTEFMQHIVSKGVDINCPINDQNDTPLILSVKNFNVPLVKLLLQCSRCKKNCLNANNFSALDVALVSAFDSRNQSNHESCWEIVECLLRANAQPVCKDAMMHVIRNALKYCNEDFMNRLFQVSVHCSNSYKLHELILLKLHRHQPIYPNNFDPVLKSVSKFSVKLLKNCRANDLGFVINSLQYYLDSHWNSRGNKFEVVKTLILYATAAGWKWTDQQIAHINQINLSFGQWCHNQRSTCLSLSQISRVAFRRSIINNTSATISALNAPSAIKDYIMLTDVDDLLKCGVLLKEIFL